MTFSEIVLLFFSGLSTIVFFWMVGRVVLLVFNWKSDWPAQITALSIVVGFSLTIVFYSLLRANQGKTISVVMVVVTLLWLMVRRKSGAGKLQVPTREDFKKIAREWSGLIIMLFFYLPVFIVQLIKLDAFDSRSIPLGSPDFPFYITVSEQLNAQGIENVLSYLNQIQSLSITSSQPYHFFDLWFNAFLQWVIPSNHVFVYLFVCIPALVFFGFLMLIYIGYFCIDLFCDENRRQDAGWSWKLPAIAFLFLFLIGYFPYPKIGHQGFEFLDAPLFSNPKFYYSYFLLAIGIPFYVKRLYLNLAFVLLATCYFFVAYIPIASTIMLIIGLAELRKNGFKNIGRELWYALSLFAAGIVLIGLFYYLQPSEKQLAEVTKVNSLGIVKIVLKNFFSLGSLLSFVRAYAVKVIYFIPFIAMILGLLWNKTSRLQAGKLLACPAILIVIGAFWSFAFSFHIEGFQFLIQTFSAGLYMSFFIALLWVLLNPKTKLRVACLILIGAQFILSIVTTMELGTDYEDLVSADFKEQIIKNQSKFSSIGLNVMNHEIIYSSSRNVSPYLNYYTGFVKFLPHTWLLQASVIPPEKLNKASKEFQEVYLRSPFVQFMNSEKMTWVEAVKAFVKENKISFFVWKKGNIDETAFAEIIDNTIYDSQSGYCISFCKPY